MAFTRFNGTIEPFAKDATGTNRTVFGDVVQSDDINDNLNTNFKLGWEIVGINDNPTKQDFNALAYTISNLVSYLYQQGIAEYNATQKYLANSYVVGSNGEIYQSLAGDATTPNVGNDPLTDTVNWRSLNKLFASINGNNTQTFKAKNGVADDDVVNKGQNDLKADKTEVIGINQTWQEVKNDRAIGTNYLNSTGKPIMISIYTSYNSGTTNIYINDTKTILGYNNQSNGVAYSVQAIIPNGSTYRLESDGSIYTWVELR